MVFRLFDLHFKHILLLGSNILLSNIWRQKYNSNRSSHLKPLPERSESPVMFPNIQKALVH